MMTEDETMVTLSSFSKPQETTASHDKTVAQESGFRSALKVLLCTLENRFESGPPWPFQADSKDWVYSKDSYKSLKTMLSQSDYACEDTFLLKQCRQIASRKHGIFQKTLAHLYSWFLPEKIGSIVDQVDRGELDVSHNLAEQCRVLAANNENLIKRLNLVEAEKESLKASLMDKSQNRNKDIVRLEQELVGVRKENQLLQEERKASESSVQQLSLHSASKLPSSLTAPVAASSTILSDNKTLQEIKMLKDKNSILEARLKNTQGQVGELLKQAQESSKINKELSNENEGLNRKIVALSKKYEVLLGDYKSMKNEVTQLTSKADQDEQTCRDITSFWVSLTAKRDTLNLKSVQIETKIEQLSRSISTLA